MANLPEKNVVLVDKITNVPTDSNLFINANGEFKQASVNDVVNSSTVVSTAVETAINTAVQDSIDSHFKQATGSPILLTDTADGTLIDFKGKGRSTQKQYSGKNLLENTATTTSLNGGTFTVNEDGSVNVKGAFTDVTEFSIGTYNATESSILSGCPSGGSENTYQLRSSGIGADYGGGLGITAGSNTSIYIRVMSGQTIDITFKPMVRLASVTDATYEPYVGGVASPNPDYQQVIKSVADGGYFDGELLQGYYDANGSITSCAAGRVSSKNLIPCSEGNEINLIYQESVSSLIISYFKNGTYSSQISLNNVSEISGIVPSDVDSFGISVFNDGITPANAKPITVTINGKYALIVKSKGKNLIPYPYRDTTHTDGNAVIWTDNGDGTITANGTDNSKQVQQFYLITDGAMGLEPNTTYILNGCPGVGSLSTYNLRLIINRGLTGSTWIEYRDFGNGVTFTTPSDYKHCSIMIDVLKGTTVSNLLVKPMLRRAEVTDGTYEPYKEIVTYIPLNEPLRGVGNVSDVADLGKCEITRKYTEVVYDGSGDEGWFFSRFNNGYGYFHIATRGKTYQLSQIPTVLCDNFKVYSGYSKFETPDENCILSSTTLSSDARIWFITDKATDLSTWKAWLQANPITVQYELAEPITETIEPVDIVTYDNVTYITASDNAEMELEYPTSKVAGIASIGYSKGRKAEYEVELLKAQLLELQTAMVNSL